MIFTKNIQAIIVCVIFSSLLACKTGSTKNEPTWSKLPEVAGLDKLHNTDFALTLENPITANRNIIYSPTFLYAWDKIKAQLKSPINTDSSHSADFILLNKSQSHHNTLTENEYSTEIEIDNGTITASAFFNKTLSFAKKLQYLDKPIILSNLKVSAFGMMDYDEFAASLIQVLYYKDDDHFILKLIPEDPHHEIILAKGLNDYHTLKDGILQVYDFILQGEKERTDRRIAWKYQFKPADVLAIPVIQFNIENNYKTIEGQKLSTIEYPVLWLQTAYQRTGFILNENGAVIESEAIAAVVDSASAEIVISRPKKLIFDKPFLIIVKRTEQTNPYLAIKVEDTELLVKK
ncbi:MAG: hypothetical protein WBP58_00485 [Chitinophagaceae bacterium]